MFGGLHIAMAALKTLGDWLQGSGWVQALVQAEIATPGTADSFLRAAHVTHTRRAHQITATTLHILQRRAYTRHCMTDFDDAEGLPEFEDRCHRRAKDIPHFQYWATVLELPPPSSWSWIKNDEGVYEPHWTKLPKAAHSCYELVSCNLCASSSV